MYSALVTQYVKRTSDQDGTERKRRRAAGWTAEKLGRVRRPNSVRRADKGVFSLGYTIYEPSQWPRLGR